MIRADRTRMGVGLACAVCCALLLPSCVTHVFRLDDPAQVNQIGLDAIEDDLVGLDIVHGLALRHAEHLTLAVPHGWESAPAIALQDGLEVLDPPLALTFEPPMSLETPAREIRFRSRNTRKWDEVTRARHKLLLPEDMPEHERRTYELINHYRDDGSLELELRGRVGNNPQRAIGRIAVPPEWTGRPLTTLEKIVVTPPLAAMDLTLVTTAAAAFVVTLPISWVLLIDDETDRLPHWARHGDSDSTTR